MRRIASTWCSMWNVGCTWPPAGSGGCFRSDQRGVYTVESDDSTVYTACVGRSAASGSTIISRIVDLGCLRSLPGVSTLSAYNHRRFNFHMNPFNTPNCQPHGPADASISNPASNLTANRSGNLTHHSSARNLPTVLHALRPTAGHAAGLALGGVRASTEGWQFSIFRVGNSALAGGILPAQKVGSSVVGSSVGWQFSSCLQNPELGLTL